MKPELLSVMLVKGDNAKLVRCFCEAGVEFLVVGGTALALHGCRDAADVDDLDILVSPTIENAQRIFSAFSAAEISLCSVPESLTKSAVQVPIKNWPYFADVLTPRNGFDFDEMLKASIPVSFQAMTLHIASRHDLIKMKEDAVGEVSISSVIAKHEKDLACLRRRLG